MRPDALLSCVSQSWTPVIGDPNLTGWLTVLAYLLCFILAVQVCLRLPRQGRGFWALIAVLMLCLAVNKQLDLQSALTAAGRCLAKAQGWYAERRAVQATFILGLLSVAAAGLLAGLWMLRRSMRQNGLALAGLTILSAFVMIRAVGFHHFDALIGIRHFGVSVNYAFENAGLLLIALNAMAILRRGRDRTAYSD
ncbi:hypothetical protein [Paracoccus sp. (in: a-proteobacteria)]|uniref:hypothetical protein n=1 Tax=Paracoccus sp. TaxID=267 RepID=UPI003A8551DB